MQRRSFAGKHILITGGSTGIGLCMAQEFARRGARLSIVARDPARLDAACASIRAQGGEARGWSCDVTDAPRVEETLRAAREALGPIHGVVANCGYCQPGNFERFTAAEMDRQIDTNLKGVLYTLNGAASGLLEQGNGFIAITSSPAGNAAIFGFSIYGATKAALNNLSHALRAEFRNRGVSVHLLLPPDTQTPGYDHEVTLYPPETREILAGGKPFPPDAVARKFVEGIARNRRTVTIGFETHLVLFVIRYAPFIWEVYSRWKIRRASAKPGN